jgi:hypothetical protein
VQQILKLIIGTSCEYVGVKTCSVVSIKIMVFWDINMPKMKVQVPPKCLYIFIKLYGVIFQKTVVLIF